MNSSAGRERCNATSRGPRNRVFLFIVDLLHDSRLNRDAVGLFIRHYLQKVEK